MATEKAVIGQAQRVLVDATNKIWHKISTWTHASDVEMPDGEPLNEYLTDLNDSINDRFDGKYNSYNFGTTAIGSLDAIPEIGYSRIQTIQNITAGEYTIPINHTCYCYSGQDPASIEKMVVMIDTTDLTSIVMYIAHYSREARWTLTKIATQKQIDNLQMQIDELNSAFNQLNLFVQQSVGDLNARYQIIQDQMDWLEAELAELQEFLNDLLNELRDFKAETKSRLDIIENYFNQMYGEIGSIFITRSRTSPEVLFGGKWQIVENAYLYTHHISENPMEDLQYIDKGRELVQANGDDYVNRYDFSPMFEGRESFSLTTANLPPHWHGFGEIPNDKDRALHIRMRDENDYDIHPVEDFTINIGAGDVQKTIIAYRDDASSRLETSSAGGKIWTWNGTQANDKSQTMQSAPVTMDPLRFSVRVWMRIG